MNSIDRYITSEPEDNYTPWVECVLDALSPEFWNEFYEQRTDFEDGEIELRWLDKLFSKREVEDVDCNDLVLKMFNEGNTPQHAAKVIERAARLYKLSEVLNQAAFERSGNTEAWSGGFAPTH